MKTIPASPVFRTVTTLKGACPRGAVRFSGSTFEASLPNSFIAPGDHVEIMDIIDDKTITVQKVVDRRYVSGAETWTC